MAHKVVVRAYCADAELLSVSIAYVWLQELRVKNGAFEFQQRFGVISQQHSVLSAALEMLL